MLLTLSSSSSTSVCLLMLILAIMMVTEVLCHDCPATCTPREQAGAVCGSNGRTYSSECDLKKNACSMPLLGRFLRKSHDGRCAGVKPGGIHVSVGGVSVGVGGGGGGGVGVGGSWCRGNRCHHEPYEPVCGSDGRTYDNLCQMRQRSRCHDPSLRLRYYGFCRGGGGGGGGGGDCRPLHYCSYDYRPLCGSDGRTYNNDCEFQRAACYNRYLTVRYYGQCYGAGGPVGVGGCYNNHHNDISNCPNHAYEPVCGSDGRTYPSYCHLHRIQQCNDPHLFLRHRGPCATPGFHVRTHARPEALLPLVMAQSPLEDPEHVFNTDPNEEKDIEGPEGVIVQDAGREQEYVIQLGGDGFLVGSDKVTVGVSGDVPGGEEKEVTFGGFDEGYSGEAKEEVAFISAGLGLEGKAPVSDRGVEEFSVHEGEEEQESVRAVEVADEQNLAPGRGEKLEGEELENARGEEIEGQEEKGTVRAKEIGEVEEGKRRTEEMKGDEEKNARADDTQEGGEEDNGRTEEEEESSDEE